MSADPPPPPRPSYRLKPKEDFVRANTPSSASSPSPDHDVYAWRQHERAIDRLAGRDQLAATPPLPNRRKRDFWLLFTIGNSAFGAVTWMGRDNPFLLVFGIAGMTILSVGLSWVVWQIMSRY